MNERADFDDSGVFSLQRGEGPVLYSVPHAGTDCPPWLQQRLNASAAELPDTDWFVDRLYQFVLQRGQTMLVACNTRYLVDLNRPTNDQSLYPGQATTGLCPTTQFDGAPIYGEGLEPDADEVEQRIVRYWQPYHQQLQSELVRLQELHGYAVLFDCHSIDSRVPRLFKGTLPLLNLGTNHGTTAAPDLEAAVAESLRCSGLTMAVNGRFVGGYITRTYGQPLAGVNALQLELGWDGYLSAPAQWDSTKARLLKKVLLSVAEVLESWRPGGS